MSIYMQFAPYKLKTGDWRQQRDSLRDAMINTLSEYAPDLHRRFSRCKLSRPGSRRHVRPNRRPPISW